MALVSSVEINDKKQEECLVLNENVLGSAHRLPTGNEFFSLLIKALSSYNCLTSVMKRFRSTFLLSSCFVVIVRSTLKEQSGSQSKQPSYVIELSVAIIHRPSDFILLHLIHYKSYNLTQINHYPDSTHLRPAYFEDNNGRNLIDETVYQLLIAGVGVILMRSFYSLIVRTTCSNCGFT